MFTGIVTDIGEIAEIAQRGDTRIRIRTGYDVEAIALGASIACDGVCLTVVETGQTELHPVGQPGPQGWFAVDASAETLARSTLGGWVPGQRINLERALKVGDELGGHIVSGHVDGLAEVLEARAEGDSMRYRFRAPPELARFIAEKGSVALNGTSLTVNEVEGAEFGVNIIPHTAQVTTWGAIGAGDRLNLEIDLMARYVARLADASPPGPGTAAAAGAAQ
ncbi:MAG: riboflavin synthase [Pseudomonadota bacterium]